MSITNHTLEGRRAAEALMTSTVAIGTVTDGTDEVTFDPIQVIQPVWEGRARIFTRSISAQSTSGPAAVFVRQELTLTVPVAGTEHITDGMAVKVTSNPLDAALVDVVFTIRGTSAESHQVARRFTIERTS